MEEAKRSVSMMESEVDRVRQDSERERQNIESQGRAREWQITATRERLKVCRFTSSA